MLHALLHYWQATRKGRLFNGLTTASLLVEIMGLLIWITPYEMLIKRAILRVISKRPFRVLIERVLPISCSLAGLSLATDCLHWLAARMGSRHNLQSWRTQNAVSKMDRMYKTFFTLIMGLFTSRAYFLLRGNGKGLVELERAALRRRMLAFRPSGATLDLVTSPFRRVFSPVFTGLEKVPLPACQGGEAPLLFVSNHTILGFEFPLLLHGLYRKRGIYLRAMADHSHFQVPGNAEVLRNMLGAVDGTQDNAAALLQAGRSIFCYPGGARETFKRTTDEKYSLHWTQDGKKHTGFVRTALRNGATIIPTINVGTEDMFWPIADLPLGWLPIPFLWNSKRTLPLVKPPAAGKVERIYFTFGDPIPTAHHLQRDHRCWEDEALVERIWEETRRAVLDGIAVLRQVRVRDPHNKGTRRSTLHRKEINAGKAHVQELVDLIVRANTEMQRAPAGRMGLAGRL